MVRDGQLIEDLRAFAEELGKTPTYGEMDSQGPWSTSTYENHFGTWNDALEEAGLEKNKEKNIPKEQLIEDLLEFAEELGKTPTRAEMNSQGPWSARTYERHFCSWNGALEEAGLETNEEQNIPDSKEQLIEDLLEFAEEFGKTPTQREMNSQGPWSGSTYKNHFGTWNDALEEAGLETNKEQNIPKEQLIEDLLEFAEELGRTPTYGEMDSEGPWGGRTYERHFCSWNGALEEAGLEKNKLANHELAGTGENTYGRGWAKARRSTLERDGYECRVCGSSEDPHVHHIKPRRDFDNVSLSNFLVNLITLCPSCHARFEGKWKDADPDEFEERAKRLYALVP